jgi:hypothetical protein
MRVKSISSQPDSDGLYRVTLIYHGREIVIFRRRDSLPELGPVSISILEEAL